MKRSFIIIGILLMVGVFILSSCGVGHMFRGDGMMGYRGYSQPYQDQQNRDNYTDPSYEQTRMLEELDYEYHERFIYLEEQIRNKEQELTVLLNSNDPDINEVKFHNREIRELSSRLDEEGHNYEIEAQKIFSGNEK